ncbi:MAG: hypothetical protein QY314_04800 [Candidatus Dojkabacteria bacterium]|nr:MAG: hypothetical protein QY314_04800 [Candidatus Dojkabacteria bacterium]
MEKLDTQRIIGTIATSKRYSAVSPKTIAHIVTQFAAKHSSEQKVLDESKNLLHRIWGAYYSTRPNFQKLKAKVLENEVSLSDITRIHFSTSERAEFASDMYKNIYEKTNFPKRIADFGCGLNPLLAMQQPFASSLEQYDAFDIDIEEVEFLNATFSHTGQKNFSAAVGDLLHMQSFTTYDAIFLLKVLPVVEMIEKGSTERILRSLKARFLVISFPAGSLSQHKQNMGSFYEAEFTQRLTAIKKEYEILRYPTEIIFIVMNS